MTATKRRAAAQPDTGTPVPPPIDLQWHGVTLEDWPGEWKIGLTFGLGRPAVDAAVDVGALVDAQVPPVLVAAAQAYMTPDPDDKGADQRPLEYLRLVSARDELATKYAEATAKAEEWTNKSAAAAEAGSFEDADQAAAEAEAAGKLAARYDRLLAGVDGKLVMLRPQVAAGQRAAVNAAFQAIQRQAQADLADLIRTALFSDGGRGFLLAVLANGQKAVPLMTRAMTVRDPSI